MSSVSEAAPPRKNAFGTFGGVFCPSILTIFGLIMFMRANHVIGNAGVPRSLFILCVSSGITFLTGLSISGISSNTPVRGGGAYFLISRVLGPGFGTAIGVALFVAQALSVPFYILGFTEAFTASFPAFQPFFLAIALGVLAVLFALTWVGAGWVIKLQYVILGLLVGAIAVFLAGAWQSFDLDVFRGNLEPHYQEGESLWTIFAVYFPAVTGIMAGVNMSGDLKEPARSIPVGTLAAVVLGFLVYGIQIVLCGGLATHEQLVAEPYRLLVSNAVLGLGWLVAAGVFCATISSAIGSNLGAPRVLQAVGRDRTLAVLRPFARGTTKGDEPHRALIITFVIGLVTLLAAGRGDGGKGLNLVAAVVTMVFLYTYGMTNLAAFVESLGANPSFRPRFRFFHWSTALVGGIACVLVAFMINAVAAFVALLLIAGLFCTVRNREMSNAYGDARRGFVYSRVSDNLIKLAAMPPHPKNWRPTMLVFSGNPHQRMSLVQYARWLGQQSGIVSLVHLLEGELDIIADDLVGERERLTQFISDHELNVFPEVIAVNDFDRDLSIFLQAYSIGPIKPNVVLLGWPQDPERMGPCVRHIETIQNLGMSVLVHVDHGMLPGPGRKRIDCWWRGERNGSLMVILAHLLMLNHDWERTRLRLLRLVQTEEQSEAARSGLSDILGGARIEAEVDVVVSKKPFADVLKERSSDATLIMLGLGGVQGAGKEFFHRFQDALDGMPSALFVYSSGEADLHA